MIKCSRCKRNLSVSNFVGKGDGLFKVCSDCRRKKRQKIEPGTMIEKPCAFCGDPMNRMYLGGRIPTTCSKPECNAKRKAQAQKRRYDAKKEAEGSGLRCDRCDKIYKCNVRVTMKLPVLCETEIWDVDKFFIQQVDERTLECLR